MSKIREKHTKGLTELLNIQDEAIKKISRYLSDKKKNILISKLAEKGIIIDIEKESTRRFKNLAAVYNNDEETIYYNDGSFNGLRIVTFKTVVSHNIDSKKYTASASTDVIYY